MTLVRWSLRSYLAANLQLLLTVGDDPVAGLHAACNHNGVSLRQRDLHRIIWMVLLPSTT